MGSVRWKREKDAAVTDSYIIKRQEKDMGKKEGGIKGKEFFPWSALFFCGFFAVHSSQYYVENEMAAENSSCYVPA